MDFLRDSIWQFIGTVVALIGLPTLLVHLLQRKRKRLSYEVVVNAKMLSVRKVIDSNVRITYGRRRIKNITLLVVKLVNSGNVPIAKSDFEKPLSFRFNEKTNILDSHVSKTKPKELSAEITVEEHSITLMPILLNARDSVEISFLLDNYDGHFSTTARIVGVSELTYRPDRTRRGNPFEMAVLLLTSLGFFVTVYLAWAMGVSQIEFWPNGAAWYTLGMTFGFSLGIQVFFFAPTIRMAMRRFLRVVSLKNSE